MPGCGYHIKYGNILIYWQSHINILYKQIDFKAKIFLAYYKHNCKNFFY